MLTGTAARLCSRQCCCHLGIILHIKQLWQELSCFARYAEAAHTAVACWLEVDLYYRHTPAHNAQVQSDSIIIKLHFASQVMSVCQ